MPIAVQIESGNYARLCPKAESPNPFGRRQIRPHVKVFPPQSSFQNRSSKTGHGDRLAALRYNLDRSQIAKSCSYDKRFPNVGEFPQSRCGAPALGETVFEACVDTQRLIASAKVFEKTSALLIVWLKMCYTLGIGNRIRLMKFGLPQSHISFALVHLSKHKIIPGRSSWIRVSGL